MEATQCDYNSAYGLTPVSEGRSQLGAVRGRSPVIADILGSKQPIYETPAANLRAAQASMAEMTGLEGEEHVLQEKRVKDLLDAANEQHTWLDPSQAHSEYPGPNPGAPHNPSGHHQAEGSSSHRTSGRKGEGSYDRRSQCQSEPTSSLRRRDDESNSVYEAIQYFIDGCRDSTLLKHKLMCSEPTSLALLMAKADKYATADSSMRVKVTASDKVVPTPTTPKPAGENRGGQNNNKRKADQLDSRSNNKLVANVEGEVPATQAGSQQRRTGKNDCQPKLSFEQMLDAPCKMHSGAKPSTHTLRHCSFA
ncbi:Endoglucanase 3 [Hordeum vulgare]|nr:Endoglucanase 3 [Hordeum vulgare]